MSCRAVTNSLALTILALAALAAVPEAAADDAVCEGFDRKHRISRLGGSNAFTRTPVTSPADLARQLDEHRAEIEAILNHHGLGHLTDDFYDAVRSERGLSERDLERGETFDWMVYRKRSGPVTAGPMCVSAKKTYDAYVVEVTEEKAHPATAKCSLSAKGGECIEDEVSVDAGGSSPGVEVTMTGPGGTKTIISGGSTSWKGTVASAGTYTVKATAEATGTKTVTTHTFVIPKICLNLAYAGSTSAEVEGDTATCAETASVAVEDCRPTCAIEVDPALVPKRGSVVVDVDGRWDDGGIRVEVTDPKGRPFATLTDFPATLMPKKKGTYTLAGTATNTVGSATCGAEFTVGKVRGEGRTGGGRDGDSRWTARFFGFNVKSEGDFINTATTRPDGVSERTHTKLDDGEGFGAGLEYHFNPRVGLEASVLSADIESEFLLDIDVDWESDEDDVSMLAFLIGPNFHLTPGKRVDFYVGVFAAFVDLGDATYRALGETHRRSFDADTTFGAQLGLDIPFGGKGWAVHLGARYLDLTVEIGENSPEIAADPFIAEVGFAYSF